MNKTPRSRNASLTKFIALSFGLAAAAAVNQPAHAITTWTNAAGTQNFGTAGNWSNGVPSGVNGGFSGVSSNALKTGTSFPILSSGSFSTQWGTATQYDDFFVGSNTGNNQRLDVTGGALSVGQFLVSPDGGGNGNVVNLSAGTINSHYWLIIGRNNAVGDFNMTGGTVNSNIDFDNTILGNAAGSNAGTLTMTGGTFNVGGGVRNAEFWVGEGGTGVVNQSGGVMNTRTYFVIGRNTGSNGTYNLSGGTVNAATIAGLTSIGAQGGATGTLSVSGSGVFNSTRGIFVGEDYTNAGTATGILTVSGSGVVNAGTSAITLAQNNSGGTSSGTINLNGGTIRAGSIGKGTGSSAIFNFNGGTLQATASGTTFMTGLTTANVKNGGAVIDTNSFNVTIGQALVASGTGGLIKNGAGALTLTGSNTYTGNTVVSSGTLIVGGNNAVGTTSGTVSLNGGTLAGVTFGANFDPTVSNAISVEAAGGTITDPAGSQLHIAGNIGGSGALGLSAIAGASGLRLEGNNSGYSGTATVTGGGVRLGSVNAGSAAAAWVVNGGLQIDVTGTTNFNLGSLSGNSTGSIGSRVANGNSTLTVGALNAPGTTFDGTIVNNTDGGTNNVVSLTKVGNGTLTLTGSNGYTGATTVSSGTLSATGANSLTNSGTISVTGGSAASARLSIGGNANFSSKTVNITTNNGGAYDKVLINGAAFATYGTAKSSLAVDAFADTTATFLSGTTTVGGLGATVQTSFTASSAASNDSVRLSDVFAVSGMANSGGVTDNFVLQLQINPGLVNATTILGWDNGGLWVNAVTGNTGGTAVDKGDVAWNNTFTLGDYGRDTATGNVWAVVNHNSDFAIVPEPSTWAMLLGGFGLLVGFQRRRRTVRS